ncbi:MAG: nicotinamide riboside transporter PnuC [Flavobacteriaceae bacterium]
MTSIYNFFLDAYRDTPTFFIVLEAIAFVFGILSVCYAKKVNIWVYPTGLISTIITIYLLYKAGYLGDMMINFYYSVMSVYGWWNWARRKNDAPIVPISRTNKKEKLMGLLMFIVTVTVTYSVYRVYGNTLETANYIDVVTSGIFFTAMWYMATKKLENWTLWIIGDIITVPLYAYRGLGMLSFQYLLFTFLAIQGYRAWKNSLSNNPQTA